MRRELLNLTRDELLTREIIYSPHEKVIVTLEEDTYLILYYNTVKNIEDEREDIFMELDRVPLDGVGSLDDIDNKINYLMAEYNLKGR